MVNLIYENGEFHFKEGVQPCPLQTIDVFLTVKDVVPYLKKSDLTHRACLFISQKFGKEYSSEGVGDLVKSEVKAIDSISEMNFRLSQK